jgi:hypothetical protein
LPTSKSTSRLCFKLIRLLSALPFVAELWKRSCRRCIAASLLLLPLLFPAHRCLCCVQAVLRGSLRKAFGGLDLLLLGLGIVIGSGWAQLTGSAAQQYAG